jgi:hypothetical protein
MINTLMDREVHYFKAHCVRDTHQCAYFSLKFSPLIAENYFSCEIEIEYLGILFEDNGVYKNMGQTGAMGSRWSFDTGSPKMFKNSIMLRDAYRSFGIGTFLFNTLLQEGVKHAPSNSFFVSLSPVDEKEGNKERRNSMYYRVGLKPNEIDHKFEIDRIENLTLLQEFPNIEELQPQREFIWLFEKLEENSRQLQVSQAVLANNAKESYDFYGLKSQYNLMRLYFATYVFISLIGFTAVINR